MGLPLLHLSLYSLAAAGVSQPLEESAGLAADAPVPLANASKIYIKTGLSSTSATPAFCERAFLSCVLPLRFASGPKMAAEYLRR